MKMLLVSQPLSWSIPRIYRKLKSNFIEDSRRGGFKEGRGQGTVRVQHKDGHWVWLNIKGRTFKGIDGETKGLIVSRDITSQIKTREELEKSEKKYREMAELLPDIIYEAETNSNLTYVNPIGYELLGHSPEDLEKGVNIFDVIHEYYKQKALKVRKKLLQGEKIKPSEIVLVKKDEGKFYGRFNAKVRYVDGQPAGFMGTISDISDFIKTKEKLEESKKKYKDAYDKANFFKNLLAHDIANVLNNINLSIQLIKMNTEDGAFRNL